MKLVFKILLLIILLVGLTWIFAKVSDDPTKRVELEVPFLCQAPDANWDMPWQEACEEAALIMAIHYVRAEPLDKKIGNQEILDLVKFQKNKYNGHYDITAKKTAQLLKDYYNFNNYKLLYEFDINTIKQELAKGNLVLAPMAGRMLGNRYFRRPGPAYHFLVFIGYDDNKGEFITNDPGTKRGQGYRYKYTVAFEAIHDWTGKKDTIIQGKKVIIVVEK